MSLRTFGKSSRFLLSIIVINFFDPLLASIPTRTRLLAFSQPKLVFLRPLRGCHSELSGRRARPLRPIPSGITRNPS